MPSGATMSATPWIRSGLPGFQQETARSRSWSASASKYSRTIVFAPFLRFAFASVAICTEEPTPDQPSNACASSVGSVTGRRQAKRSQT